MIERKYINLDSDDCVSYNTLAKMAFNYYNGRINVISPAILNIEWTYHFMEGYDRIFAVTNDGCVITLYLAEIIEYCNNYTIKTCLLIIECIIHELYHVDQKIYMHDVSYVDEESVENPVRWMTKNYLNSNVNEICLLLNNSCDREELLKYMDTTNEQLKYPYIRKNIVDIVVLLLASMLCVGSGNENLTINKLYDIVNRSEMITLNINGLFTLLKVNGVYANIFTINNLIYNHYRISEYDSCTIEYEYSEYLSNGIDVFSVNASIVDYDKYLCEIVDYDK